MFQMFAKIAIATSIDHELILKRFVRKDYNIWVGVFSKVFCYF